MRFGAHISISGSIANSIPRAIDLGCDTFQIFTRNPRSWTSKELTNERILEFKMNISSSDLKPVFVHMPYLPNLASPDPEMWEKSIFSLKEELNRCDLLEIPYIVTHLGSPKTSGKEKSVEKVIQSLNKALTNYNGNTTILLENTAGKNESLGSNIDDICNIITKTEVQDKLGLCLDTCHAFASGYDLRDQTVITKLIEQIDGCIGLNKLLLIHANDAKFDLGEGRDRHEHIGLGKIGEIGFKLLLKEKKLRKVPFICETPVDERRDGKGNLEYLRKLLEKAK